MFLEFINESFDLDVWNVVGSDTTINAIYSEDFEEMMSYIVRMLDEQDVNNILFINEDIGFGADYLIFAKDIIPNSKDIKQAIVRGKETIYYIHLKEYEKIKYVVVDMHSTYDYTLIFITKVELDELNRSMFPDEIEPSQDVMSEEGGIDFDSDSDSEVDNGESGGIDFGDGGAIGGTFGDDIGEFDDESTQETQNSDFDNESQTEELENDDDDEDDDEESKSILD